MADSAVAPLLPPPAGGAEARGGSAWGVYLAVALTALGPVSFGYVLGFSSPAAAPLLASGMLTAGQLNMFEALSPLGAIAGAGCAGIAADYLGRTRSLALCCAPFALGWALISAAEVRSPARLGPARLISRAERARRRNRPAQAGLALTALRLHRAAQNAAMLFVGRLFTGAGVGCVLNIVPVYVAEIAPTTCVPPPKHPPCACFLRLPLRRASRCAGCAAG
jgi:MFS family permease